MRNRIIWMVLLLAIPAMAAEGVAGKWHFVMETDDGQREVSAVFEQSGEQVSGTWQSAKVQGTFAEGKLKLAFPLESPEAGPGTVTITATLEGEVLQGRWGFQTYGGGFKATREK